MQLPKKFMHNVSTTWGKEGSLWLDQLPALISYFSKKWQLQNIVPFSNLSYHYVARAFSVQYKSDVVLKLGIPIGELDKEQKTLNYFNGHGCVKLLAHEINKGAMLLQSINPGTTLKTFFPDRDIQAIEKAARVMQKLHTQPISSKDADIFPTINNWYSLLDTFKTNKIPQKQLQKVQKLSRNLLSSQKELYVLHGDLHHENILFDELSDTWLAIDPKGVIGERACEIGPFIYNPLPELLQQSKPENIIARRFDQFSTILIIDQQKLIDWSYTRAILAACWSLQSNDFESTKLFMTCAEIIAAV